MPRPLKFDRLTKPKLISLLIPGLGAALGRTGANADRLRVSSGTRDRARYVELQAMYRDLGRRLLWDMLRARLEQRFDTPTLFTAYRQGEEALTALLQTHTGRKVWPLYTQWQKEYRRRSREKTFANIERFLAAHGGKEATTACLTDAHVAAFLADLTDARVRDGAAPRPATGATRNRYRSAIGVFCTHLVARGHLAKHPIAFKAVAKDEEADPRMPAPFTPDEYRGYFDALARYRPDYLPVFRMLIHTGGDIGEVLSRAVRDVDLDRRLVTYKRAKVKKSPTRVVPIPEAIVAELRGHVAAHELRPASALFGMFDRANVVTAHRHAARAISRPELRVKDLRHLAAIAWVQAGTLITIVQQYLGHETLQQTMVYARFAPKDEAHQAHADKAAELMRGPAGVVPIKRSREA